MFIKKISLLIIGLSTFVLLGISFASNTCMDGFSEQETNTLNIIKTVLDNNTQRFEEKFPGSTSIIQGFVSELSETLDCNGGFTDYESFETGLRKFVFTLISIKTTNQETNTNASQELHQLQKHLVNIFNMKGTYLYDESEAYLIDTSFTVDLSAHSSYDNSIKDNIAINLNGNLEGKMNTIGDKMDMDFTLVGNVDIESISVNDIHSNTYADANINTHILMQDEDLYIQFHELDVNIQSDDPMTNAMIHGGINEFKKKVYGSYIHMNTLDPFGDGVNLMEKLQRKKNIYQESILEVITQEDTHYVRLNILFCKILQDPDIIAGCTESFQNANKNIGNDISFTSLANDTYKITYSNSEGTLFVIRNNDDLEEIFVKSEDLNLTYKYNKLQAYFGNGLIIKGTMIPQKMIDLTLQREKNNDDDGYILEGTITINNTNGKIQTDVSIDYIKNNYGYEYLLETMFNLHIQVETQYQTTSDFTLTKPHNIIELQELEETIPDM